MIPDSDEFFVEECADEIWDGLWRDIVLYSVDTFFADEIAEANGSVIRTKRHAHINPAPHEAARDRLHAITRRYNLAVLAMFQGATDTATEGEA